ncbi:MAG TPA: type II toxin-antitoxin system HicB family antitoxin [Vicinamibacterales bacterium]|jgi:antitoxin HicB|nr:type II toxin-antitoxin system HicB family antitoxin [Vicinamibacterales bacterium]
MLRYTVKLTPDDNGTLLVTLPDFPEAHTFGEDKEEALARAVDAAETVIDAYIRDRRPIPAPSPLTGDGIALSAIVDAKVQIYNAMLEQHVGKAALAKRLHVHLPQIDRLLDIKHGSKVEQLEAAASALGGRLDMLIQFAHRKNDVVAVEAKRMLSPGHRRTPLRPAHALASGGQSTRLMGGKGKSRDRRKKQ